MKSANLTGTSRILLWALVAVALLRLLTLGMYPLMDTTEARYAEIARKMVELGDWVTPWFDYGVPFWGKPPMSFWITAASFKVLGVNEFAARLPHFLSALVIAWLVWDWMRNYSAREATLALAMLVGAILFFVVSGAVTTDITLALSTTIAMRGFWLGLHGHDKQRQRERWLLFVGLGLGLLAKGPVAWVLTGVPIVLWALVTRNIVSTWRGLPWLRGLLLALLIGLPWYALAEIHSPGFLNYFIIGEHWHRFVISGWKGDLYGHAHAFPRGTIWLFAFTAMLPWPVLLLFAIRGRRRALEVAAVDPAKRRLNIYLLFWGITPCLFFTTAGNILWTYMLPAVPALVMLGAVWLARDVRQQRVDAIVTAGLMVTGCIMIGYLLNLQHADRLDSKTTKHLVSDYMSMKQHDEALIFVGSRPFSADFYSAGKAQEVKTIEQLMARIDQVPAYVAIRKNEAKHLPAEAQQKLTWIAHYGDYELFSATH